MATDVACSRCGAMPTRKITFQSRRVAYVCGACEQIVWVAATMHGSHVITVHGTVVGTQKEGWCK